MPLFYSERGFLKAVANNDVALVDQYFAHGGKDKWLAVKTHDGSTPLHHAAAHGAVGVIKKLLAAGVGIETPDEADNTPLASAVLARSQSAVAALVEAGANVNVKTAYGSLLKVTVNTYAETTFKYLLEHKADPDLDDPLGTVLYNNYESMVQPLLKAGAKIDGTRGADLLHYAARNKLPDLLEDLLARGVDINAQNKDGWTAMHQAVYNDRREFFDLLLQKGARTDIKNNAEQTPLDLANGHDRNYMKRRLGNIEQAELVKTATPLNAEKGRMPDDSAETWVLMGPNQVAHVGVYPAMGRRLTQIFNFENRERLVISENLKTGAENVTQPEKFDTLEDGPLQKALAAFRDLGGKADDAVLSRSPGKKSLAGPGA